MEISLSHKEAEELDELFKSGMDKSIAFGYIAEKAKIRKEFKLGTTIKYFIPCRSSEEADEIFNRLTDEGNTEEVKETKSSKTDNKKPVEMSVSSK